MEQRDFILDEIRKFGQMVLGLIGKLSGRSRSQQSGYGISMADQEFESEAGFSLRMLTEMDMESLQAFLKHHPELTPENLELLADLLIELSDDQGCNTREFLLRARDLLDMATGTDRVFSMEREGKLDFINSQLAVLK